MKFVGRRCLRGAYELVAEQKASARNSLEQSAGSLSVYNRTEFEPRTHPAGTSGLAACKALANHKKVPPLQASARAGFAPLATCVRNHCHSSRPARHPAAARSALNRA